MPSNDSTAIVTGAGKRVGAVIARALVERGWSVIAQVRSEEDDVPPGSVKAAADLADPACARRIFEAAVGLPPVRLLINNAARFVHDGFGAFSPEELDSHIAVNLRAPLLLTEALAAAHAQGERALIVNMLDSKLSALNPDFLSYTLSKQALQGLTVLAARALAPRGIRVNGIAPALMLRSAGQTDKNFRAMHARNPLKCGAEPEHVVAAIDYLLASPAVTGEVLTIDGGQHFSPPGRDVQFLEDE